MSYKKNAMYLLYTDEVNIDPESSDFFVYGGVAISGVNAGPLSSEIDALRNLYGYNPGDILKFNTVERPAHISATIHREIKREIIEAAVRHEVKLFASFILHQIATTPDEARRKEINRICYHFDCYMRRVGDIGLVLIDTFQDDQLSSILREKFSIGLRGLPYSSTYRLEKVVGFHLACMGSSNYCSIVDIVLGALRYSINSRRDPAKYEVVNKLLSQLSPLFIRSTYTGKVEEISLFFSPKSIKVPAYLEEYQDLYIFLADNGLDAVQAPSSL